MEIASVVGCQVKEGVVGTYFISCFCVSYRCRVKLQDLGQNVYYKKSTMSKVRETKAINNHNNWYHLFLFADMDEIRQLKDNEFSELMFLFPAECQLVFKFLLQ